MDTSSPLLLSAARAALDALTVSKDSVVEATGTLAEEVWALWTTNSNEPTRRADIEAMARAPVDGFGQAVDAALEAVGNGHPPQRVQAARAYLVHLPAAFRRALRRPADPAGTTLPMDLVPRRAEDLLTLLPARTPWLAPGDRPADVGDWELVELILAGAFGEAWKARNPASPGDTSILVFCLNPALRAALARDGAALLDRVMTEADHPGILRVRKAYLAADPPCVVYEGFEAGDLAALAREWHTEPGGPSPVVVAALVQQLAEAVGHLHGRSPPLVHRRLRPSRIFVARSADGFACKIIGLALESLMPPEAAEPGGRDLREGPPTLYLAPEQQRGEPPDPRDDVYALGVLWYQLLTGNLLAGRPGGSTWRRRLADRGMAAELIDLLETCFEDDPNYRPADAGALAKRLGELAAPAPQPLRRPAPLPGLGRGEGPAAQVTAGEGPTRLRPRGSVLDVFGALEQQAPELPKVFTNGAGMKLVLIPPGTFTMGTPAGELGRCEKEGPAHEVSLTRPFYLGVFPVSQEQYERVMGQNPARFHALAGGGPDHPVESVTWEDAVAFCRRLSQLPEEVAAGRAYRLPTEAEWEYACRAGTTTPFSFGAALSAGQVNFDGHFPYGGAEKGPSAERTTRVGSYPANLFGLHDMHGNVWEWCSDWHDPDWYRKSPKRDPQGPPAGRFRVLRGGCWRSHAATCRSGYRNGLAPASRDRYTGFRVAADVRTTG